MTDVDAEPGFDRRALIKKGLLAGGIVATAPVITTFNTAAFASSVQGCHRVEFNITGADTATPSIQFVQNSTETCVPDVPATVTCTSQQTGVLTSPADVTASQAAGIYTFTLVGSYASCEIVAARAHRIDPNEACLANNAGFTQVTPAQWTFNRATPNPDADDFNVVLLVFC